MVWATRIAPSFFYSSITLEWQRMLGKYVGNYESCDDDLSRIQFTDGIFWPNKISSVNPN